MEQSQSAATAPQVGPVVHRVKEHTGYFEDLIRIPRSRPYELRENDRGYKTGDGLRVVEWDSTANDGAGAETGRSALLRIAWTSDDWGRCTLWPVALGQSVILLGVELLMVTNARGDRDLRADEAKVEDLLDSAAFVEASKDPGPPVPFVSERLLAGEVGP